MPEYRVTTRRNNGKLFVTISPCPPKQLYNALRDVIEHVEGIDKPAMKNTPIRIGRDGPAQQLVWGLQASIIEGTYLFGLGRKIRFELRKVLREENSAV